VAKLTHIAVVEDGIVGAVSLLDLVQRLRDQKGLEAIAGHERQRALEEIQPTECGKLVEHQQYAMAAVFGVQILGQPPPDLVQHEADQRLRVRLKINTMIFKPLRFGVS
jgi:hypothetical protein